MIVLKISLDGLIVSKKICGTHGLYIGNKCMKCIKNTNKTYDKIFRDEEMTKFYHSALWRKVRVIQLQREPLCVMCNGIAKMVDHIKEIKDGGSKLSLDNLQSMCLPCHNLKTAEIKAQRVGVGKSLQTKTQLTDPPTQKRKTPCEGG